MPLCFAAITPHPPLLIPNIGKDKVDKLTKTKDALEKLEQDIYLSKADLIIVISPHASLYEDSFAVSAHNKYHSEFEKFGDLVTKKEWKGSPDLAAKIGHEGNVRKVPIRLVSNEGLDHGASVPLFYLTNHLPNVKVLPIGFSHLDAKKHLSFGELLKDIIMQEDKRIAVIASGDLSHRISDESPEGFHKAGQKFDNKLIKLLETRNTDGVVGMDSQLIEDASQCGWRSVLILLGILKEMDYEFKNYSYEAPFGVGYLVGNFVL